MAALFLLAGLVASGLAFDAHAQGDATAVTAPKPSASRTDAAKSDLSPTGLTGTIQTVGLDSAHSVGRNVEQLTFMPDGGVKALSLPVVRADDKTKLAVGATARDRVWLTVDDPAAPTRISSITRIARPVSVVARCVAILSAVAIEAAIFGIVAAIFLKRKVRGFFVGIDCRLSNSQVQLIGWWSVVALAYGATTLLRVYFLGADFIGGINLTANVFGLTGLSGLTFGGAKLVAAQKNAGAKDVAAEGAAKVATIAGGSLEQVAAAADAAAAAAGKTTAGSPQLKDLVTADDGSADLGDFQMIVITAVSIGVFAWASFRFMGLIDVVQATTLPDVDSTLLGAFGVGQGAYLVKKAVTPVGKG